MTRVKENLTGKWAPLVIGLAFIFVGIPSVELAQSSNGPLPPRAIQRALATGVDMPLATGVDMPLATPLVPYRQGPGPPGLEMAAAVVPPPARIQIPAIGVDAPLGQVGLQSDGTIAVPSDWNQPAWYTDGPAPGAQGPAVIVGHRDSTTGPAVFWRLATLKPGQAILITRRDGSVLRYRVASVGVFPRDHFPTAEVYGPTPDSVLRLITCGGTFDWAAHKYSDNVVAFARPG